MATIIPTLRYQNAPQAVEWLQEAFGFETQLLVPGENETITHAQLVLGGAMIMLGSVKQDDLGETLKQPEDMGGYTTQTIYVYLADVKAHYDRAREKGAVMIRDLETMDYGGEAYTCKDLEGHIWSFGSYDPWA